MSQLIVELMTYVALVSGSFSSELGYDTQLKADHRFGLPEVHFVSEDRLFLMHFERPPEEEEFFSVQGAQFGHNVYLTKDWDKMDIFDQSKLLHELVHVMQDDNGLHYECNGDRERLAYYIQEKWLMEENGVSQAEFYQGLDLHPLVMVGAMSCSDEHSTLARPGTPGK